MQSMIVSIAILEDVLWELRERLEVILRALYILNPDYESGEEESSDEEDEPPLRMYS
jgi:hypothetical protein